MLMEFVVFIPFSTYFSVLKNPFMHPVKVGILPLGGRNPQRSCIAFLEGRFVSWDTPNPDRRRSRGSVLNSGVDGRSGNDGQSVWTRRDGDLLRPEDRTVLHIG